MTAQCCDYIRLARRKLELYELPLDDWFAQTGTTPGFSAPHTALWRGYVATWEIRDDRLYLVGLKSHLPDGREGTLGDLFPDSPDRVFAHWYSGTLRVPQGKEIGYVHAGFGSIHESMLCITVCKGIVSDRRVMPMPPEGV
jgi:hypothetical protein